MLTFSSKRDSMCVYTVRCDAGGVRTQQVLRQDGTVCQTAGAVVCDSRPAVAALPSSQVELETYSTVPGSSIMSSDGLLKGPRLGLLYHWQWDLLWQASSRRWEGSASVGAAVVNVM